MVYYKEKFNSVRCFFLFFLLQLHHCFIHGQEIVIPIRSSFVIVSRDVNVDAGDMMTFESSLIKLIGQIVNDLSSSSGASNSGNRKLRRRELVGNEYDDERRRQMQELILSQQEQVTLVEDSFALNLETCPSTGSPYLFCYSVSYSYDLLYTSNDNVLDTDIEALITDQYSTVTDTLIHDGSLQAIIYEMDSSNPILVIELLSLLEQSGKGSGSAPIRTRPPRPWQANGNNNSNITVASVNSTRPPVFDLIQLGAAMIPKDPSDLTFPPTPTKDDEGNSISTNIDAEALKEPRNYLPFIIGGAVALLLVCIVTGFFLWRNSYCDSSDDTEDDQENPKVKDKYAKQASVTTKSDVSSSPYDMKDATDSVRATSPR